MRTAVISDVHSNLEAQTVWACSTGPLSMDDNDERERAEAQR